MEAYFDNSATTRCYPEVAEIVVKTMTEDFGNPSAMHLKGVEAEKYVREAAQILAKILKVNEKEIIFTSGGTESNNLALFGGADANKRSGNHIITTSVEHAAVGQPAERLEQMERGMDARLRQFESRVGNLERSNAQGMEQIRSAVAANLHRMQTQQQDSLAEIQSTVNEKLAQSLNQKIGQSFQLVSSRLEQVYQGLGEMQTLAVGVGDLKKVLSNVKTRGILGEVQLGAILQEILAPEQYATEIPTLPNSRNHVEFAVRMPADGEQPVWLPIDSKFPGDTYAALQDAREQGDPAQVEAARQKLLSVVRSCAKDIRDKYVQPPYTTNFGILFLPFEGLYAEVVNSGLVEQLQREYSISVAGPSTMAAILNALQMGFRTLAIQKHSHEAWVVLGAVRSEFEKFAGTIEKAQKSLQGAEQQLELLAGTRTRAIVRQLREVERLQPEELRRESE